MDKHQGEILTMEIVQNESNSQIRPLVIGQSRIVMERELANLPEELLTVLLHDLRSPLGALDVLTDVISKVIESGAAVQPRQIQLLQEAVSKAQRIIEDAVEIQSLIRGSSTFSPSLIEMRTIVRNSLEKAHHAPYFRNVNVDYDSRIGNQMVKVDVEKAETALLCALEQSISLGDRPTNLRLYHTIENSYGNVHISNERARGGSESPVADKRLGQSLRGRLGTRKLGESRYNLLVCSQVLSLMGGRFDHSVGEFGRLMNLRFPLAAN